MSDQVTITDEAIGFITSVMDENNVSFRVLEVRGDVCPCCDRKPPRFV